MKAPKLEIPDGSAAQQLRHKLNLNQAEFWGRLKVTQSGDSRYESGRNIPEPIKLLMNITYGTQRHADRLLSYLREKKEK